MILVTGGAGFIGAHFILGWLGNCDEPDVNLDKLTYAGNLDNLASIEGGERHVIVRGDIVDSETVAKISKKCGVERSLTLLRSPTPTGRYMVRTSSFKRTLSVHLD